MKSAKVKTVLGITAVVGFTILLHSLGWLGLLERSFRSIPDVGSRFLYHASVALEEGRQLPESETLEKEYFRLLEVEQQYKLCQVEQTILTEERDELREQLHFVSRVGYRSVGADVIGKNIEPLGNTLIINRGSQDGLHLHQPVVTKQGMLIGKLARVDESTAVIRLLNDPSSKIAATVLNQDHSLGLIEGGYGLTVQMNFIPQNEIIMIGDAAITSGLEQGIPRGLLIGTIDTVQKEAYQPFQQAVITPAANLNTITTVSILIL